MKFLISELFINSLLPQKCIYLPKDISRQLDQRFSSFAKISQEKLNSIQIVILTIFSEQRTLWEKYTSYKNALQI